jgi:hypothetical protein
MSNVLFAHIVTRYARAFIRTHSRTPAQAERRSMKYVLSLLAIAAVVATPALLLRAQNPPSVQSVTVQFTDGSQQQLLAATQPSGEIDPHIQNPDRCLGINLEGLRDYDRSFMFIDAMKTCRKFGTAQMAYDEKGAVDANGWPTGDAGTLVMTDATNINGLYHFYATGQCDLTAVPATVRNLRYDERSNRTMAEILVNQPKDAIVTLTLMFKNTFGGLKNIKLFRPGYDSDAEIYTKEFNRALQPFGAIRFMDFLATNNSAIKTWNDRAKPADATFSTDKGGPYEFAIEMGNRTNKDIWLNIPALADDDHITKLGELVRAKLKPNLNCFVEYSNEVWNGQFKQANQNFEAAKAEVAAGEKTLSDGGRDANVYYWAWKRVAKRSIEIKKLMGDDPRIKVILASQVGYDPPGTVIRTQLEYVDKYHGPPSKFIYAVACAPYFSPGMDPDDKTNQKWYTQRDDLSVDLICNRLLTCTGSTKSHHVKAFHDLAKKYNVKSFAYEAGLDMQQYQNSLKAKVASNYDPRMGDALEQYLTNWYAGGGDSLFYFNLNCRFGPFGYWGLTEDARMTNTPKYQAATKVAQQLNEPK